MMKNLMRTPAGNSMKWFWIVMLSILLFVNENLIRWLLSVIVGHKGIFEGFHHAFRSFTWKIYLLGTVVRVLPYLLLSVVVLILAYRRKRAVTGIAWGGISGIAGLWVYGTVSTYLPGYMGEHVSSTAGIVFLFLPIYAIFTGLVGAFIGWGVSIAYRD